MAEADLTVIRVGESVWSTWEPEDGHFSLDWLEPVLDGAHQRGISVILGTPTYAMPPWLARKYPEVRAERQTGVRIPYGHRQDADYSHPAFRFHADRVVRQVVGRYADHPAIIGYQVDNEPGMELFHNRGAFETFVDRLRERYGDVATLSDRWGLVYWSHRLSRWDDLWVPDGNTVPSYDLAWRRFQSALTTEFISAQAAIVKELARSDQFVTTCMSSHAPPSIPPTSTATWTSPRSTRTTRCRPRSRCPSPRPRQRRRARAGTSRRAPGRSTSRPTSTRAARDEPFLVTETNAISIGEPHSNFPAYDGQWRQAAWALVSRGARMVEYWHWHSIHFGHEAYWLGVLNHDGEPGRCYGEVKRIAGDFKRAGSGCRRPRARRRRRRPVLAREQMGDGVPAPAPPEGSLEADTGSYERIFGRFYEGLFGAGLQADIVYAQQLGSDAETPWPLARARGPRALRRRRRVAGSARHVRAGGRPPRARLPQRLRRRGGAAARGGHAGPAARGRRSELWRVHEPRRPGTAARGRGFACPGRGRDGMGGRAGARGRRHARGLRAPAPRPLGGGDHPRARPRPRDLCRHVARTGRWPWRSPAGCGRRPTSGRTGPDRHGHERANAGGGRVRFVSNWSWEPTSFALPVAVRDLLSATTSGRRGARTGGMGRPGADGEPGGRTTRGEFIVKGARRHAASLAACSGRVLCSSLGAVVRRAAAAAAAAVVAAARPRRSTWPPSSRSRRRSRCGRGRPVPTRP